MHPKDKLKLILEDFISKPFTKDNEQLLRYTIFLLFSDEGLYDFQYNLEFDEVEDRIDIIPIRKVDIYYLQKILGEQPILTFNITSFN